MINLKADTILSKGCRTKRKAIEAAKIPLRSPASGRKYAAAYYNIRIKKTWHQQLKRMHLRIIQNVKISPREDCSLSHSFCRQD